MNKQLLKKHRWHCAHPQGGLALITVMLVVAVVASISVFLSLGQQIWLRQSGNIYDRSQAEAVRQGAVDFAAIVLELDANNNKTDHLQEIWASQLPPFAVEQGEVAISVEDAQGRFNLNNLINKGVPSTHDIGVYRRLLAYHQIDTVLVDTLLDWMDADQRVRPGGAEDNEYLSRPVPYLASNQAITDLEELRFIKGYTPEIISSLRNVVVVLPAHRPINVNTAVPSVLGALYSSMSLSDAEDLAKTIRKDPLNNIADLAKKVSGHAPPKVTIDIKSSYFLVHIEARFGRSHHRSESLVYRPPSSHASKIIWHGRPPINVAATDTNE
ncbi:MAG: type II secretion system minor pseudopilin GspK [Acidiferrobacterales bacterium]